MEPSAEDETTTRESTPVDETVAKSEEAATSAKPSSTATSHDADAPAKPTAEAPVETADEEPSVTLRSTTISIAATAFALTILSAFLFEARATVGVAVGGALATLNFILFIRLVGAFLSQKGNAAPWAVLAGVKLLGLFAFVYIILKRGDLPALSLAIGYGALPIGISVGSLFKPRPVQKLG